jgi:hypothetical protein
MPPQSNRLAPRANALANYIPMPTDPRAPQVDPRLSPGQYAQNVSAGLGYGLTNQLRGVEQLVRDPVTAFKESLTAIGQFASNPAVALQMLRELRQRAAAGPLGFGEVAGEFISPRNMLRRRPPMQELDVYHGTPHRFPATKANPLGEFDASKVGTGEGAQAYGHGIYFAENPKVARGYATQIPYRNFEKKVAQVYSEFDSPDDAMEALKEAGLSAQELGVVQALQNDDFLGFDYPHQALRAALKESDNFDLSPETKLAVKDLSSLYKADLPDAMIDRMLDWDKPFNQQPENVKKALLSNPEFSKRIAVAIDSYGADKVTGGSIHSMLSGKRGEIEKTLAQMGIPGIRYLDAGSRGKDGTGTRNFVVFPGEEKKVKILKRE